MASTYCSDVKIGVCILTVLFGMGAWLATNATFVELPILVDHLPEGWNLPSYMAVVVQLANIGPIIVTSCNIVWKKQLPETFLITTMIFTGATASLCMAYFWTRTSFIAGSEHSTAFMVLLFFFALVDCSSSVVFLPFMNNFKPRYVTFYYVGSGLGGLLPSVVALFQGVGKVDCVIKSIVNVSTNITEYQAMSVYRSPVFPVKAFFLFTFAIMTTCAMAFLLLNYLPYCKKEHVKEAESKVAEVISEDHKLKENIADLDDLACIDAPENLRNGDQNNILTDANICHNRSRPVLKFRYIYYLSLIGLLNALTNGVLPSIQSYACLPYGSKSYHLSVTLSNIANPVGCFLVLFLPVKSGIVIGMITIIGSGCSMYILALAALSPALPLVETVAGSVLVVSASVIVYFLLSFAKVTIASKFREQGKTALFWCGAVTQLGSTVGAAVMFVAINVFNVFTQTHLCT